MNEKTKRIYNKLMDGMVDIGITDIDVIKLQLAKTRPDLSDEEATNLANEMIEAKSPFALDCKARLDNLKCQLTEFMGGSQVVCANIQTNLVTMSADAASVAGTGGSLIGTIASAMYSMCQSVLALQSLAAQIIDTTDMLDIELPDAVLDTIDKLNDVSSIISLPINLAKKATSAKLSFKDTIKKTTEATRMAKLKVIEATNKAKEAEIEENKKESED